MTVKKITPKTTLSTQAGKAAAAPKVVARKIAVAAVAAVKPTAKSAVRKAVAPKENKVAAVAEKKTKNSKKSVGKIKVVRDSFTMPQDEYAQIGELKQLCLKNGLHAKKSELLRAGLIALGKMSTAQLKSALTSLLPIKTGRPEKK